MRRSHEQCFYVFIWILISIITITNAQIWSPKCTASGSGTTTAYLYRPNTFTIQPKNYANVNAAPNNGATFYAYLTKTPACNCLTGAVIVTVTYNAGTQQYDASYTIPSSAASLATWTMRASARGLSAKVFNIASLSTTTVSDSTNVGYTDSLLVRSNVEAILNGYSTGAMYRSALFTGFLFNRQGTSSVYCVNIDDGAALYFNNVLIVRNWLTQPPTRYCSASQTISNLWHPVKLYFYQWEGGDFLSFESNSGSTIVPTANLLAGDIVGSPFTITGQCPNLAVDGTSTMTCTPSSAVAFGATVTCTITCNNAGYPTQCSPSVISRIQVVHSQFPSSFSHFSLNSSPRVNPSTAAAAYIDYLGLISPYFLLGDVSAVTAGPADALCSTMSLVFSYFTPTTGYSSWISLSVHNAALTSLDSVNITLANTQMMISSVSPYYVPYHTSLTTVLTVTGVRFPIAKAMTCYVRSPTAAVTSGTGFILASTATVISSTSVQCSVPGGTEFSFADLRLNVDNMADADQSAFYFYGRSSVSYCTPSSFSYTTAVTSISCFGTNFVPIPSIQCLFTPFVNVVAATATTSGTYINATAVTCPLAPSTLFQTDFDEGDRLSFYNAASNNRLYYLTVEVSNNAAGLGFTPLGSLSSTSLSIYSPPIIYGLSDRTNGYLAGETYQLAFYLPFHQSGSSPPRLSFLMTSYSGCTVRRTNVTFTAAGIQTVLVDLPSSTSSSLRNFSIGWNLTSPSSSLISLYGNTSFLSSSFYFIRSYTRDATFLTLSSDSSQIVPLSPLFPNTYIGETAMTFQYLDTSTTDLVMLQSSGSSYYFETMDTGYPFVSLYTGNLSFVPTTFPFGSSDQTLFSATYFVTWANLDFDDSAWGRSIVEAAVGTDIWGMWWAGALSPMLVSANAQWIWGRNSMTVGDANTYYFRSTFRATTSGTYSIIVTIDNVGLGAYVDGILQLASGFTTSTFDIFLGAGKHVLAVIAQNSGGPGGYAFSITPTSPSVSPVLTYTELQSGNMLAHPSQSAGHSFSRDSVIRVALQPGLPYVHIKGSLLRANSSCVGADSFRFSTSARNYSISSSSLTKMSSTTSWSVTPTNSAVFNISFETILQLNDNSTASSGTFPEYAYLRTSALTNSLCDTATWRSIWVSVPPPPILNGTVPSYHLIYGVPYSLTLVGASFLNTTRMTCRFNSGLLVGAVFINTTAVRCIVPTSFSGVTFSGSPIATTTITVEVNIHPSFFNWSNVISFQMTRLTLTSLSPTSGPYLATTVTIASPWLDISLPGSCMTKPTTSASYSVSSSAIYINSTHVTCGVPSGLEFTSIDVLLSLSTSVNSSLLNAYYYYGIHTSSCTPNAFTVNATLSSILCSGTGMANVPSLSCFFSAASTLSDGTAVASIYRSTFTTTASFINSTTIRCNLPAKSSISPFSNLPLASLSSLPFFTSAATYGSVVVSASNNPAVLFANASTNPQNVTIRLYPQPAIRGLVSGTSRVSGDTYLLTVLLPFSPPSSSLQLTWINTANVSPRNSSFIFPSASSLSITQQSVLATFSSVLSSTPFSLRYALSGSDAQLYSNDSLIVSGALIPSAASPSFSATSSLLLIPTSFPLVYPGSNGVSFLFRQTALPSSASNTWSSLVTVDQTSIASYSTGTYFPSSDVASPSLEYYNTSSELLIRFTSSGSETVATREAIIRTHLPTYYQLKAIRFSANMTWSSTICSSRIVSLYMTSSSNITSSSLPVWTQALTPLNSSLTNLIDVVLGVPSDTNFLFLSVASSMGCNSTTVRSIELGHPPVPVVNSASGAVSPLIYGIPYTVTVSGSQFLNLSQLMCRFAASILVPATYINSTAVLCVVPTTISSLSFTGSSPPIANTSLEVSNFLNLYNFSAAISISFARLTLISVSPVSGPYLATTVTLASPWLDPTLLSSCLTKPSTSASSAYAVSSAATYINSSHVMCAIPSGQEFTSIDLMLFLSSSVNASLSNAYYYYGIHTSSCTPNAFTVNATLSSILCSGTGMANVSSLSCLFSAASTLSDGTAVSAMYRSTFTTAASWVNSSFIRCILPAKSSTSPFSSLPLTSLASLPFSTPSAAFGSITVSASNNPSVLFSNATATPQNTSIRIYPQPAFRGVISGSNRVGGDTYLLTVLLPFSPPSSAVQVAWLSGSFVVSPLSSSAMIVPATNFMSVAQQSTLLSFSTVTMPIGFQFTYIITGADSLLYANDTLTASGVLLPSTSYSAAFSLSAAWRLIPSTFPLPYPGSNGVAVMFRQTSASVNNTDTGSSLVTVDQTSIPSYFNGTYYPSSDSMHPSLEYLNTTRSTVGDNDLLIRFAAFGSSAQVNRESIIRAQFPAYYQDRFIRFVGNMTWNSTACPSRSISLYLSSAANLTSVASPVWTQSLTSFNSSLTNVVDQVVAVATDDNFLFLSVASSSGCSSVTLRNLQLMHPPTAVINSTSGVVNPLIYGIPYTVTVYGALFLNSSQLVCRFANSTIVYAAYINSTTITCTVPTTFASLVFTGSPIATATVSLDVSNYLNVYNYSSIVPLRLTRLNITSISPKQGPYTIPSTVTIASLWLDPSIASSCYTRPSSTVAYSLSSAATYINSTHVQCIVPPGAEYGSVDILLSLSSTVNSSLLSAWSYYGRNNLTSCSPNKFTVNASLSSIQCKGFGFRNTTTLSCFFSLPSFTSDGAPISSSISDMTAVTSAVYINSSMIKCNLPSALFSPVVLPSLSLLPYWTNTTASQLPSATYATILVSASSDPSVFPFNMSSSTAVGLYPQPCLRGLIDGASRVSGDTYLLAFLLPFPPPTSVIRIVWNSNPIISYAAQPRNATVFLSPVSNTSSIAKGFALIDMNDAISSPIPFRLQWTINGTDSSLYSSNLLSTSGLLLPPQDSSILSAPLLTTGQAFPQLYTGSNGTTIMFHQSSKSLSNSIAANTGSALVAVDQSVSSSNLYPTPDIGFPSAQFLPASQELLLRFDSNVANASIGRESIIRIKLPPTVRDNYFGFALSMNWTSSNCPARTVAVSFSASAHNFTYTAPAWTESSSNSSGLQFTANQTLYVPLTASYLFLSVSTSSAACNEVRLSNIQLVPVPQPDWSSYCALNISSPVESFIYGIPYSVTIPGSPFLGSLQLVCQFNSSTQVNATFINPQSISCDIPDSIFTANQVFSGYPPTANITVQVSNNLLYCNYSAPAQIQFTRLTLTSVYPLEGSYLASTVVTLSSPWLDTSLSAECLTKISSSPSSSSFMFSSSATYIDSNRVLCVVPAAPSAEYQFVDIMLSLSPTVNSTLLNAFYYFGRVHLSSCSPNLLTFNAYTPSILCNGIGMRNLSSLSCNISSLLYPAVFVSNSVLFCVLPPRFDPLSPLFPPIDPTLSPAPLLSLPFQSNSSYSSLSISASNEPSSIPLDDLSIPSNNTYIRIYPQPSIRGLKQGSSRVGGDTYLVTVLLPFSPPTSPLQLTWNESSLYPALSFASQPQTAAIVFQPNMTQQSILVDLDATPPGPPTAFRMQFSLSGPDAALYSDEFLFLSGFISPSQLAPIPMPSSTVVTPFSVISSSVFPLYSEGDNGVTVMYRQLGSLIALDDSPLYDPGSYFPSSSTGLPSLEYLNATRSSIAGQEELSVQLSSPSDEVVLRIQIPTGRQYLQVSSNITWSSPCNGRNMNLMLSPFSNSSFGTLLFTSSLSAADDLSLTSNPIMIVPADASYIFLSVSSTACPSFNWNTVAIGPPPPALVSSTNYTSSMLIVYSTTPMLLVRGTDFFSTGQGMCRFYGTTVVPATFINSSTVLCQVPSSITGIIFQTSDPLLHTSSVSIEYNNDPAVFPWASSASPLTTVTVTTCPMTQFLLSCPTNPLQVSHSQQATCTFICNYAHFPSLCSLSNLTVSTVPRVFFSSPFVMDHKSIQNDTAALQEPTVINTCFTSVPILYSAPLGGTLNSSSLILWDNQTNTPIANRSVILTPLLPTTNSFLRCNLSDGTPLSPTEVSVINPGSTVICRVSCISAALQPTVCRASQFYFESLPSQRSPVATSINPTYQIETGFSFSLDFPLTGLQSGIQMTTSVRLLSSMQFITQSTKAFFLVNPVDISSSVSCNPTSFASFASQATEVRVSDCSVICYSGGTPTLCSPSYFWMQSSMGSVQNISGNSSITGPFTAPSGSFWGVSFKFVSQFIDPAAVPAVSLLRLSMKAATTTISDALSVALLDPSTGATFDINGSPVPMRLAVMPDPVPPAAASLLGSSSSSSILTLLIIVACIAAGLIFCIWFALWFRRRKKRQQVVAVGAQKAVLEAWETVDPEGNNNDEGEGDYEDSDSTKTGFEDELLNPIRAVSDNRVLPRHPLVNARWSVVFPTPLPPTPPPNDSRPSSALLRMSSKTTARGEVDDYEESETKMDGADLTENDDEGFVWELVEEEMQVDQSIEEATQQLLLDEAEATPQRIKEAPDQEAQVVEAEREVEQQPKEEEEKEEKEKEEEEEKDLDPAINPVSEIPLMSRDEAPISPDIVSMGPSSGPSSDLFERLKQVSVISSRAFFARRHFQQQQQPQQRKKKKAANNADDNDDGFGDTFAIIPLSEADPINDVPEPATSTRPRAVSSPLTVTVDKSPKPRANNSPAAIQPRPPIIPNSASKRPPQAGKR